MLRIRFCTGHAPGLRWDMRCPILTILLDAMTAAKVTDVWDGLVWVRLVFDRRLCALMPLYIHCISIPRIQHTYLYDPPPLISKYQRISRGFSQLACTIRVPSNVASLVIISGYTVASFSCRQPLFLRQWDGKPRPGFATTDWSSQTASVVPSCEHIR